MSEEPEKPKNLYQKINAVMQDVEYLSKDDDISFGNTNYKAISEEKVTMTVRESLIKHGLVILPVEQEHHREGNLTTVNTRYKIVDIETGQHEIIVSSGTGADTQDKGVGKAMTYSYKYLLLRTFAIPTGEDPDKTSSAELDEKDKQRRTPQEAGNDRLAQERTKAEGRKQGAPAGKPAASVKARVYGLREELGWGWPDLSSFASDVLKREIKFLKTDVTSDEEWSMIEKAMLVTKKAS